MLPEWRSRGNAGTPLFWFINMSLNSMVQRLIREIPGVPSSYAKTLLNEALGIIYDSQMWSWQLKTAGWLTPGLLFPGGPGTSIGTVSVTAFSDQVVPSLAAKTAWLAYTGRPFFTAPIRNKSCCFFISDEIFLPIAFLNLSASSQLYPAKAIVVNRTSSWYTNIPYDCFSASTKRGSG